MFFAFDAVTTQISSGYAGRYARSSAQALSAHIAKEIGIISVAARSDDVVLWLKDENDIAKKERAFRMLGSIVSQLYSYNLYVGVNQSLHEYRAEPEMVAGTIQPIAILKENEPNDAWFFETVNSDKEYLISINMDHLMQRKRVWLDYKVQRDGTTLGVICTGLEFSHIAGELFSHYDKSNMRGLIIDNNGTIFMDSILMEDNEYLFNEYATTLREEFTNPVMIEAVEAHLNETDRYWKEVGEPDFVRLSSGAYRYMTIAPIKDTNWSIIILSNTASLFDTMYFVPVMILVLTLLIAFAVSSSLIGYRILFKPLKNLDDSLAQLNEHSAGNLFGIERKDELGHLSNTIQDLFNKANIDPLTGLYNRRFMESSMERVMDLLSRSGGLLSVMMLDIDFFKRFNDSYGHDAGDKCLQNVAHALSGTISRVNDIVVRYGGEEFSVILPNTDSNGACQFAEKLLKSVRDLNISHEKNDAATFVTVSIGVTTGEVGRQQDIGMFLKKADEALYTSKESGRNKYTYIDY